jgi:hypothetical protein
MLLLIGAYFRQEVSYDFARVSFQQWLAARPEIAHILANVQYPESMESAMQRKTTPAQMRRTVSVSVTNSAPYSGK